MFRRLLQIGVRISEPRGARSTNVAVVRMNFSVHAPVFDMVDRVLDELRAVVVLPCAVDEWRQPVRGLIHPARQSRCERWITLRRLRVGYTISVEYFSELLFAPDRGHVDAGTVLLR